MSKHRKSIRQWYQKLGFQKRLMGISILVWVLPIILSQFFFSHVSVAHLDKQINELTKNNLMQIAERFSLTMEAYTDIVYQIYADETIVSSLAKYPEASDMEQASLFFTINERIAQFAETKNGIRCISLICDTGESITYDKETGSTIDNIWREYEDLRTIAPYKMTQGKNRIMLVPTQMIFDNGEVEALFFVGKEIYNTRNLNEGAVATVIIGIQVEVLQDICNADNKVKGQSVNFITDDSGRIVSFWDEFYLGQTVADEKAACRLIQGTRMFKGKNLGSTSYTDKETRWTFYNVYNNDYIMNPVTDVQNVHWLLLVIDSVLVILFMYYTSRSFTRDLSKIMYGIGQVEEGKFDVSLQMERQDEFGQIGQHFNNMTGKVRSLIDEVKEISEKKSQAEIKALESQINPHFLYNTLDAINWMAIGKGEYEISKMVSNLGYILRYTMNQSNGMVSVREMEEWLKSYVALYQLRYNNSFEFQMHVEPEVREVKVYKLLLQPVIENAILHGIKEVKDGLVRVDVGYVDEGRKIYLVVEDNGVGMEEEMVHVYNKRDIQTLPRERIGLTNVFERILLYYGEEGSWHISSVKGEGTIVEMFFPVVDMSVKEDKDADSDC
ncbi:MAG: sensor histidine kinase [Lachnospiraceae bacterium]|nr:sensor histidine kinase [Lachnospiraceae bacterium]